MKTSWIIGFTAVLLLAACQSAAPLKQYTKGEQLSAYDFASPHTFEEGAYGAATLEVVNGVYEIDVIQGDNVLWWGQWGDTYTDSVVDVDTDQMSETNDNAYGVMCRVRGTVGQPQPVDATLAAVMHDSTPEAESTLQSVLAATAESTGTEAATAQSTAAATAQATEAATAQATEAAAQATVQLEPNLTATPTPTVIPASNGDGYLFLIQGGGEFAIMRSRDRHLTALVNWTASDAVHQGSASNHIRAVCAGSYLAMYVNDQFVGDATDSSYTGGQVGLAASSADRLGTRIEFDNLTISAAATK